MKVLSLRFGGSQENIITANQNTYVLGFFARPFISCDLYAVPCSMIGNPDVYDLGKAKNLRMIWNSEKYTNFRRSHLHGNIPEMCKLCYA